MAPREKIPEMKAPRSLEQTDPELAFNRYVDKYVKFTRASIFLSPEMQGGILEALDTNYDNFRYDTERRPRFYDGLNVDKQMKMYLVSPDFV